MVRTPAATWSALAGVGERVLRRRMGHASSSTTDRYIKAATSFDAGAVGGTVFHDASCLGALVDRFAQHCHVIDIDAESWRNKEATLRRGKNRKTATEE